MKPLRILLATGQPEIDNTLKTLDYTFVGSVYYKNEIAQALEDYEINTLIVGEGLTGEENIIPLLIQVNRQYPHVRIIYFAGGIDVRDIAKVYPLGTLVMAGIYDIVLEKSFTLQSLRYLLENPKTKEDTAAIMEVIENSVENNKENRFIEIEVPKETEDVDDGVLKNLFVVSSIKPGTGKSFLSSNIAAAIAKYGIPNKDGKPPKVGLIEADLQNLSIGTILGMEDNDKYNLKTVMDKIDLVLNEDGELLEDPTKMEEVNNFIKKSFVPYYYAKNLKTLVGSQISFDQLKNVKAYHYIYLIEAIINDYDVVIVDTNSALTHVTTYPLLKMAKTCYYVVNLDFNNVRNNFRYRETLKSIDVLDKVKFVLNEDVSNEHSVEIGTEFEELKYTAENLEDDGFELEARIPVIPKKVFLNRLYEGTPVVLDDIKTKYTQSAKYELLKVANQIWPIQNFQEIEQAFLEKNKKNTKRKGLFR